MCGLVDAQLLGTIIYARMILGMVHRQHIALFSVLVQEAMINRVMRLRRTALMILTAPELMEAVIRLRPSLLAHPEILCMSTTQ